MPETPQTTQPWEGTSAPHPASESDQPTYQQIGPYRVLSLLGRGGMGEVVLAERDDGAYRQQVAIKLLRVGHRIDPELLLRIRQERQLLAMLEHPGIARLLDGGHLPGGDPYLVLEYVRGETITEYSDAHALSLEARLQLFLKVCEAVQYAHQRLIVHRDIKPDNLLVTAEGVPKLLDFGIAKLIEGAEFTDLDATHLGARAMTPAYCSPEQLRGEAVTVATDVYLLGLLLYELLTGSRAQQPTSKRKEDIEQAVCERRPVLPSQVPGLSRARMAALRGDLDTIMMQALAKDPARRFASVAAMAADIHAHLGNRPISARADSRWYLLSRFVRRNAFASTMVLGFVLLIAAALWREQTLRGEAEQARDLARMEAQQAELARQDAESRRLQAEAVAGFVERMLTGAAVSRSGGGPNAKIVDVLEPAWTEAQMLVSDSPLEYATLAAVLSRVHASLGQYQRGYEIATTAMSQAEPKLPAASDAVLNLRNQVAANGSAIGHNEEALVQREAVLKALLNRESEGSPVVLLAQRAVANTLSTLGRSAEAAEIYRQAIDTTSRIHGAESDQVLELLVAQSTFLFSQGQFEETTGTLERIVDIHRARGNLAQEQVQDALHLLSLVACSKGQYAIGAAIVAAKLQIYTTAGEPAYSFRAGALNNLALMQVELGQLDASRNTLDEAMMMVKNNLGESHPSYRHLSYQLADLADLRGESASSVAMLEDLAKQIEKSAGIDSWQVLQARARVWLAKAQNGEASAAVVAINRELQSLQERKRSVPALASIVQDVAQIEARARWLAGQRDVALTQLQQAYADALADEDRYGFSPRTLARQLISMQQQLGATAAVKALQDGLLLPPQDQALMSWVQTLSP